jgi:hypothetical protein
MQDDPRIFVVGLALESVVPINYGDYGFIEKGKRVGMNRGGKPGNGA